ncbi:MAG: hypothetical protein CVT77_06475 [Alphaproteobacteria bacterium HGW-Alphaproteobacteria-16]|nr:MAG: hypothetical protein CVT77_06475 [Alphaproteobacteria bacterium HGW-Alphaproteobacteria-16]
MFRRPPGEAAAELQVQLAEIIGEANVTRLIEQLGGTRTFVPKRIGVHHPIAHAIGAKAASLLADRLGGATLDLPKAHYRRQRALETALNMPEGMTIKDVALSFDYTERMIYKMLEKHRADQKAAEDQMSLFDLK